MRRTIPGLQENQQLETPAAAHIEDGIKAAQIQEMVRLRAYEFYQQRGRQEGHDLEDWVRAEAEIHAALGTEGLKAA